MKSHELISAFDIKFLSHFARNTYFYFYIFLALFLTQSIYLTFSAFFVGLVSAIFTVLPVYFLNDYTDEKEDKVFKKPNLYISFKRKKLFFWTITISLLMIGGLFSFRNSIISFLLFILFYLFNWFYSFLPYRLRDKHVLREINIFAIYFIKSLLFATLFHYPLSKIPLSLVLIPGILVIIALSLYKHYLRGIDRNTFLYFCLFILLTLISGIQYPLMLLLILPLIPIFVIIIAWHKKIHIPINLVQFCYFAYAVFIFLCITVWRINYK